MKAANNPTIGKEYKTTMVLTDNVVLPVSFKKVFSGGRYKIWGSRFTLFSFLKKFDLNRCKFDLIFGIFIDFNKDLFPYLQIPKKIRFVFYLVGDLPKFFVIDYVLF